MARNRGPRRLSAEEAELWRKVIEGADPLHPERPAPLPAPVPPPNAAHASVPDEPLAPFTLGGRPSRRLSSTDIAPPLSQQLSRQPVAMDHKAFTRMRRGKLQVEGRIDLHGMTLDQAHPTLINFIMGGQAMGKRLILVITGKGQSKRQNDEWHRVHGVLKRQVPLWLRMPPLSGAVLQVSEAHQSHGGSGAYYVYLRRLR